jgi:hypothetical protein
VNTGEVDLGGEDVLVSVLNKSNSTSSDTFEDSVISAYSLGDMLQAPECCNKLIDEILPILTKRLGDSKQIKKLWDTVPHNSKLTRLFVDCWAIGSFSPGGLRQEIPYLPQGFVNELACVGNEERYKDSSQRHPAEKGRCFYHHHRDDADKCK